MGLQLIFIWSRVVTAVSGALQQDVTVFLNYMAFKAVFGDGRIVTLGAIIQMFPGVGADMHVKMHLVPKKFAAVFTLQVSVNLPDPLTKTGVHLLLLETVQDLHECCAARVVLRGWCAGVMLAHNKVTSISHCRKEV